MKRNRKNRRLRKEREMKKIIGVGICFLMMLLLVSGCTEYSPSTTTTAQDKQESTPDFFGTPVPQPIEKIYSQGVYDHVEYKTSNTDSTVCTVIYYEGGGAFIAKSTINIPASKGDLIKVVDNDNSCSPDWQYYKVVKAEDKKAE